MTMPEMKLTVASVRNEVALLISPVEQDHQILGTVFGEQDWTLYAAHSLGSASTMLRESVAPVVITERDLPVGSWRDVLEVMQLLPSPPLVIVTSLHADEHLWAEALNLGAYDVVAKPFRKTELTRVLNSAWMRRRQASASRSRVKPSRNSLSRAVASS